MSFDRLHLESVLETLGAYLEEKGTPFEIVAIGGSGLLLLGVIDRSTRDLDVIAIVERGRYRVAQPLPMALQEARDLVAEHLGLDERWLNAGPAEDLFRGGLPKGFKERVETRRFGGLTLHLASRRDQIFFKLHAAADRGDPQGKHATDLRALQPAREELIAGARWSQTHDPSTGFRQILLLVLADFGIDDADTHLRPGI